MSPRATATAAISAISGVLVLVQGLPQPFVELEPEPEPEPEPDREQSYSATKPGLEDLRQHLHRRTLSWRRNTPAGDDEARNAVVQQQDRNGETTTTTTTTTTRVFGG
ncbi:hypothetical protein MKZ38_000709 [Zalerion maritima]|uniref:Secreted protein n=1 Tax=Zalerion maritima TaxID=339359 RepID=A0AAD5WRW6_9PEZI|nr:hypothetical protein MKZ38_000709 [Zalerion maritima]